MEYYSALKKIEFMNFEGKSMHQERIIELSNQDPERQTLHILYYVRFPAPNH